MKCIECDTILDDDDAWLCNECIESYDNRIIYKLTMSDVLREIADNIVYDETIGIMSKDNWKSLEESIEYHLSNALEYFSINEVLYAKMDAVRDGVIYNDTR